MKDEETGIVTVDAETCIGCKTCMQACPYEVRVYNDGEPKYAMEFAVGFADAPQHVSNTVEKCTMCEQLLERNELPACVAQCGGRARFFGDLEQGLESFVAPGAPVKSGDKSYDGCAAARVTLGECTGEGPEYPVKPYTDAEIHHLPDVGNKPSFVYILRRETWQGGE